MQRSEENQMIIKKESKYWSCAKCGKNLLYWKTKSGKLVHECATCGWAKVVEEE